MDEVVKKEKFNEYSAALRSVSGNVSGTDRVQSFLYDLMRDHLPPGKVEEIVRNCDYASVSYTNGWLANYAADLSKRLREGDE
jgi:hypothetical protein